MSADDTRPGQRPDRPSPGILARVRTRFIDLGERDRRALMAGVVILVPVLLWFAVVRPWWTHLAGVREAVAAEQGLLEREQVLLREAPTLPDRIADADLVLRRKEAQLVQYPNLALAEAAVTRRLEASAAESRALLLEVRSVQAPVGEEPPQGLVPIRLQIRAESDFEGLLTLLNALEADPLLFRVVGLSMQPQEDEDVMTLDAVIEAYAPADTPGAPIEGTDPGPTTTGAAG